MKIGRREISNHGKILMLAFASNLPALGFLVYTVLSDDFSPLAIYSIILLVAVVYAFCFSSLYERLVRPWQVAANMSAALKEQDFTLRAKYTKSNDAMGRALDQLNSLGDCLQGKRMGLMATHQLLFKILQEMEAAVLCFDQDDRLVMVNRYAKGLFLCQADELLSKTASELGLKEQLATNLQSVQEIEFPLRKSRWLVRRSSYREDGLPHVMLLIADLQGPLREEELDAWKKLIRVLGHELNNSMTPLKSMADSLGRIVSRDPLPDDWKEDVVDGLALIGSRVDGLNRFVKGYAELARMPAPKKIAIDTSDFVDRVIHLDTRLKGDTGTGPSCSFWGEEAQLEQVFINVFNNAFDAMEETSGRISINWLIEGGFVSINVLDEGRGIMNPDNLFVPFFSTKESGSGIGLALSRQIVEAHDGRITLENRGDRKGCVVTIRLPLVRS